MADELEFKSLKESIDKLPGTVKEFVEKAKEETKTFTKDEVKEATKDLATKEEVKAIKDETDKIREEWEKRDAKRGTSLGSQEVKSFNQLLAESVEENMDQFNKFNRGEIKTIQFQMKAVGDMGITSNYTGTRFLTPGGDNAVRGLTNRKLHIRDIPELPKGTMTGSSFPYMKENGVGEGSMTTVAENAAKPQLDFDLTEATAEAQYVAGWLRTSRKSLADVPGFLSYLQGRLLEKLLLAEDDQLINGTGVSPNISGLATAGNFTAATSLAAAIDIEQLILGISQLEEMEREANAILLRPSNAYSLLLNKASTSGEYDLPGVVTVDTTGQLRIMGVPVYRTTAMTAGTYFIGDFRMGAMLLQREPPTIEISTQDASNFTTNKVTIRCEERIAFPIFGSTYFIKGTF